MPRKTDGIPFELFPRPTKGADGKPLLFARPQRGRKITLERLDALFTSGRSFSHGDFRRTMETFIELTAYYIANGYRIETPIGSFAPKLKTRGEYTDASQVTNGAVCYAGIEFTPSKAFACEVLRHQQGCHKAPLEQAPARVCQPLPPDEALRKSLEHGIVTVRAFQAYSGLTKFSARKYLDSLCEGDDPLLRRYKIGRVLHYEINPHRVAQQE